MAGAGAAWAAAAAQRRDMMFCDNGHDRVEWRGTGLYCFICLDRGTRLYPDPDYAKVNLLHPKTEED